MNAHINVCKTRTKEVMRAFKLKRMVGKISAAQAAEAAQNHAKLAAGNRFLRQGTQSKARRWSHLPFAGSILPPAPAGRPPQLMSALQLSL